MSGLIEPSSDIREVAGNLFGMYRGFVMAGFTEEQSMTFVTIAWSTQMQAATAAATARQEDK